MWDIFLNLKGWLVTGNTDLAVDLHRITTKDTSFKAPSQDQTDIGLPDGSRSDDKNDCRRIQCFTTIQLRVNKGGIPELVQTFFKVLSALKRAHLPNTHAVIFLIIRTSGLNHIGVLPTALKIINER